MTTTVDIVNRALQKIGTRSTITSLSEQSNEAIQANLILNADRDQLLRMAPWNCSTNYNLLVYITSLPGTPENQSATPLVWQKGLPSPPWAYEYQYPVDCLRPLWIVPQVVTGFASGVPITTAVTGGAASTWMGPPVRFKVEIDQFVPVVAVEIVNGGTGYQVGDLITFARGPAGQPPIGAPAQVIVTQVGGGGFIAGVALTGNDGTSLTSAALFALGASDDSLADVNIIATISGSPIGGSYFTRQSNPIGVGSTNSVSGTGALFNLTFGPIGDQRVIVTNQESAILCYIRQVVDPNVMDPLFLDAWSSVLGARLTIALTGDKTLANMKIAEANNSILEARKADGNEGLTINNVTPDWIRTRGVYFPFTSGGPPGLGFDWGNLFPNY